MSTTTLSDFATVQLPGSKQHRTINVVVVSSVALAFISFWRAAAIVLCDLASTAYYIGGISEQAIGKAAPWFILGVMLFSYAVRAVYVESCTMFTRGGVYRVVKEAMGGSLAKLSVSALMFDYVLTGPISAVSAGQYMVGLFFDMLNLGRAQYGHAPIDSTHYQQWVNFLTVILAILITIYFWRTNIIGIHESSDKALRIMQLTTVMGILIIGWSALTLVLHHGSLHAPPLHPVLTDSGSGDANESSKGWLEGFPRLIGTLGILIAFGHTLLAMSGEESLAQVNREIESPKLKNLIRTGFVIFMYSLLLTSIVSFLAVLIIPDGKRVKTMVVFNGHEAKVEGADYNEVDYLRAPDATHPGNWGYRMHRWTDQQNSDHLEKTSDVVVVDHNTHVQRDNGTYRDNLINGLVQYLAGPGWIKIIMECFVVIVGFLILAGAVNTAIVGSNGVMNRLAEDGVLTPWFLHPQKKYGTSHRLINLVVGLQLITIVASWGDVDTLGEAYAFGVIWSFVFKTLAMVVLRFKDRTPRQYEVPLNIHLNRKNAAAGRGRIDLPIGICIIFFILLSTAMVNLATKKTATIWGVGFTAVFLAAFVILERISHKSRGGNHHAHLEQFNEMETEAVTPDSLGLTHLHPIMVAVRNPGSLKMLDKVLHETDTTRQDVVVITCKVLPSMTQGITDVERHLQDIDRTVLTRVVTVSEEAGKQIYPLVIPTNNPLYAIATAVRDLSAQQIVLGASEKMEPELLAEQFALAWGMALADAKSEIPLVLRIIGGTGEYKFDL